MTNDDRESFDNALSDPSQGLLTDFSAESKTVIIAFGGMSNWLGIPPFEFFSLLNDTPVGRIFVRDLDQAWYHMGVRGSSDDIDSTTVMLQKLCADHGIQRIVCVGTSAGAFGALTFGSLLGADEVHAFGAQTTIARRHRIVMLDRRWSGQLVAMRAALGARPKYFDAKRTLKKPKNPETKFHMHWGREEHLDGVHAKRLKSVPGVVLHEHDGKHNVAGTLREQGRLKPILLNAVGLEDHS